MIHSHTWLCGASLSDGGACYAQLHAKHSAVSTEPQVVRSVPLSAAVPHIPVGHQSSDTPAPVHRSTTALPRVLDRMLRRRAVRLANIA